MPHLSPHRPRDPSLLLPFPLPLPSPFSPPPPNPPRLSYFTVKIVECSSTVREREREIEKERERAPRDGLRPFVQFHAKKMVEARPWILTAASLLRLSNLSSERTSNHDL